MQTTTTIKTNAQPSAIRPGVKVRTGARSGGVRLNHNQGVAAAG